MYLLTGSSSAILPLVDQHHRRHAGDDLGDGVNREDGIRRHRRARIDVTLAEGFEIDRLAVALDQNDGTPESCPRRFRR